VGLKSLRRKIRRYFGGSGKSRKDDVYIYKNNLTWLVDETFLKARSRNIQGIPDPRCFLLQSIIRGLRTVDGDVAECGVWNGKSSAFMLSADERARTYHLFDSFEGLSAPGPEDALQKTGRPHWTMGQIVGPEETVRSNLAEFPNVEYYKGWIPDRFAEVSGRSFALVHVDVDLYAPTRDAIAFFWPRIVPGGFLVCDDYGSLKCPGARRAVDDYFVGRSDARLIELPTGQSVAVRVG
jgi:O-methyltransferase